MRGRSQCTLDGVGSPLRSEPLIFLFTGEGAHSAQNDVGALRQSNAWPVVDAALVRHGLPGLEALLTATLGQHGAPLSPVLTTVVNLLNAARWRDAGLEPKLTIGHSIGEVAAAHVADLFSMDEAIAVARGLGMIGASLEGGMLHTRVTRRELLYLQASAPALEPAAGARAWADEPICVAAINSGGADADEVGVTLCGPESRVAAWLASDSRAKRLPPLHPWHHPAYAFDGGLLTTLEQLPQSDGDDEDAVAFISATKATVVKALDASYWRSWLSTPGARRSLRWRAGACLHAASPRSLARTDMCVTRRSQLCGRRFARGRAAEWRDAARLHGGDGAAPVAHRPGE
jgi:hypothetical protein